MEISAAKFRQNFFKLLDLVSQTQREIIITKSGKPTAKLVYYKTAGKKDPLLGAYPNVGRTIDDLTKPIVDPDIWEVD